MFAGTRVPVQTLLDYLEGGETIDDFLDGFPGVKREQIVDLGDLAPRAYADAYFRLRESLEALLEIPCCRERVEQEKTLLQAA